MSEQIISIPSLTPNQEVAARLTTNSEFWNPDQRSQSVRDGIFHLADRVPNFDTELLLRMAAGLADGETADRLTTGAQYWDVDQKSQFVGDGIFHLADRIPNLDTELLLRMAAGLA